MRLPTSLLLPSPLRGASRASLGVLAALALASAPALAACGSDPEPAPGAGGSGGSGSGTGGSGSETGGSGSGVGGSGGGSALAPKGLCSADAWCWVYGEPQGTPLLGLDGFGGEVFAVGEAGVALRRNGEGWSSLGTGTGATLVDVSASQGGVWAVGGREVLRFTDGAWTAAGPEIPEGYPADGLTGVWASPSGDVFVVGKSEYLFRRASGTWQKIDPPPSSNHPGPNHFLAVDGSADDDVWVMSADDALHFDGEAWSAFEMPAFRSWVAVDVVAPNEAWAVSSSADVARWDGTAWKSYHTFDPGFGESAGLSDVHAAGPDLVFVGGSSSQSDGFFARLEGGKVTKRVEFDRFDAGGAVAAVFAAGPGDVHFAGGDGLLGRFDGEQATHWKGPRPAVESGWASDAGDVWVADGYRLHRWTGEGWKEIPDVDARVVHGSGPEDVWASGAGRVHHFDGEAWRQVESAGGVVYALGPGRALAFPGQGAGQVELWEGDARKPAGSVPGTVKALSVTPSGSAWLAGTLSKEGVHSVGYVARFDGKGFTTHEVEGTTQLDAIHAADDAHVWVTGSHSPVYFFDGKGFTEVAPGGVARFGMTGIGEEVWVASGGDVERWDGKAWTRERTGAAIVAVLFAGGGRVFAGYATGNAVGGLLVKDR